jgi:1-acyl-sn-glycerol-3-phosphate acyltransferase
VKLPQPGAQVPRRASAATRAFGRALLTLFGWRIEGELPNLPRFVIAVAPHTSNWDFVIGGAAMFALDLRIAFFSKHTLFRGPFAAMLRWMGGIPVDRSAPHGLVQESVRAFEEAGSRVLAITPQGTRKGSGRFRTGFLRIAVGARVPVLLAALDYEARCVRFGAVIEPGADIEGECRRIEGYFSTVRGKRQRAAGTGDKSA